MTRLLILYFVSSILFSSCSQENESVTASEAPLDVMVDDHVSKEVKKAILSLLDAYNKGDGETAYNYMDTPREKEKIVNAYKLSVPITNIVVKSADIDTIKVEYSLPHPGDIMAVFLSEGCDEITLKSKINDLLHSSNLEKKSEILNIVRVNQQVKFKFNELGILQFSDVIGTDVYVYCHNAKYREFSDSQIEGTPYPHRFPNLLLPYYLSYNIELNSAEGERIREEVSKKTRNILIKYFSNVNIDIIKKGVELDTMKVVKTDEFSVEVPNTWQAWQGPVNDVDGIFYAGKNQNGSSAAVGIRKEIEANEYKNNTDGQLLLAASSLWQSKHDGVLKDSGDSTLGGVPAKFFVHQDDMQGKSPQRILSYVFVKNKAIYSFMIFCADAEFDSNYDMFIKMKDTFQFRRKY